MTWKKLNNAHFGSSTTFGGADIDKISKLFDGTLDIEEQDINSSTTIRNGKFKFRNPADTYSYTITPSAIVADRTVTLPTLANDSEFLFENASQQISNQTLSNCPIITPTYVGTLPDTVQDPIQKRWGSFMPLGGGSTNSTVGKTDGMLKACTGQGGSTPSVGWDTTHGFYANFRTGPNYSDYAGLLTSTPNGTGIVSTAKAGKFKVKMKSGVSTEFSCFCGLMTWQTPYDSNFAMFPTDQSGILIGHHGSVTGFKVFYERPGGSTYSTHINSTHDANVHTVEASWPDGGNPITVWWDGALVASVTPTYGPDPTVRYNFNIYLQTYGLDPPAPYDFRIYYAWLETTG